VGEGDALKSTTRYLRVLYVAHIFKYHLAHRLVVERQEQRARAREAKRAP
jgi:hypothetical protein